MSAKVEEARRSEMRQLGESVVKILGQYQEQPNLLDPHLEVLLCRPPKSSVFDATPFSDWFIFFPKDIFLGPV